MKRIPPSGEVEDHSVTVVICSYNHEQYLIEALDSVLRQTRLPDQLIITDDGSSDDSRKAIREWTKNHWPDAELLMSRENIGLPATLNRMLAHISGDLVAIMSADDIMMHDRLERQANIFAKSSKQLGMVYGDMIEIDPEGRPTGQRWFDSNRMGPPAEGDLFAIMLARAFISAPTVMVRRWLYDVVGNYDESLVAEDYDMFLRFSSTAHWSYIEQPLVKYRVLPSSLSRTDNFRGPYRENRIRLLRKHTSISHATDLIIAARTAKMAESLYSEGRSPVLTAADLWFALKIRCEARRAVFWIIATSRLPGPVVFQLRQRVVSLRHLALQPFSNWRTQKDGNS